MCNSGSHCPLCVARTSKLVAEVTSIPVSVASRFSLTLFTACLCGWQSIPAGRAGSQRSSRIRDSAIHVLVKDAIKACRQTSDRIDVDVRLGRVNVSSKLGKCTCERLRWFLHARVQIFARGRARVSSGYWYLIHAAYDLVPNPVVTVRDIFATEPTSMPAASRPQSGKIHCHQ